jgi:hypothetical protein
LKQKSQSKQERDSKQDRQFEQEHVSEQNQQLEEVEPREQNRELKQERKKFDDEVSLLINSGAMADKGWDVEKVKHNT